MEAHAKAWDRVADSNGGRTHGQVQARRIQEIRDRAQAKAGAVAQVQGGLTHGMPLARAQVESLDASFIALVEKAGNRRWRDMTAAHHKELRAAEQAEMKNDEMGRFFAEDTTEMGVVEQAEAYIEQTKEAARRSRMTRSTRMDSVWEDWGFTTTKTETNGRKTDLNFTKTKMKTNGTKTVKKEWRNPQSGVTRDPGKSV